MLLKGALHWFFIEFPLLRNQYCKIFYLLSYVLHFEKPHDSLCKDSSWTDRNFGNIF